MGGDGRPIQYVKLGEAIEGLPSGQGTASLSISCRTSPPSVFVVQHGGPFLDDTSLTGQAVFHTEDFRAPGGWAFDHGYLLGWHRVEYGSVAVLFGPSYLAIDGMTDVRRYLRESGRLTVMLPGEELNDAYWRFDLEGFATRENMCSN